MNLTNAILIGLYGFVVTAGFATLAIGAIVTGHRQLRKEKK